MSVLALVCLSWSAASYGVETGPVDRKWGLGWDYGLTARLWLGGVWEFAATAGPRDYLNDSESQEYYTGQTPTWEEEVMGRDIEDRTESGFARVQAGRLVSRRGSLALVCYSGLQYLWSDSQNVRDYSYSDSPDRSYTETTSYDRSTWMLSLGLRPSFMILDFLTVETAFGLVYSWFSYERVKRREYTETGETRLTIETGDGNRFDDAGWYGMGSLQFIVWF